MTTRLRTFFVDTAIAVLALAPAGSALYRSHQEAVADSVANSWKPQTAVECSYDSGASEVLDFSRVNLTDSQMNDIRRRIAEGRCKPVAPKNA
jgi:hypothetical protein